MEELLEEYAQCLTDIDVAKKRVAKEQAKKIDHDNNLELIRAKIENSLKGEDYKSGAGTVQHRKGVPKVVIADEKLISDDWYIPQSPKLDRAGIKSALKKGQEIEGATLDNGAPTLMIKVN